MELNDLIQLLTNAFEKEEIKQKILLPDWRSKNLESGIHSTGFCYVATEIIYRLTGGALKWEIRTIPKKVWEFGPHYYLISVEDYNITCDITSDQYIQPIPYNRSRRATLIANRNEMSIKARKFCELAGIPL